MADLSQLSQLTRRADSVAESASALVQRTMREIRGELANLSSELNLAGSAADREKVYAEIRRRMALLSRRMNTLMEAQNELAARGAAKSASAMTGLEVKYSPSRAKAICELVTPAQGENIAAVFTDRMGRALINALREATVATLREQAVSGGTMKDMSRDLATRWAKAAKMENPRFTDSAGHVWDTKTYIQMNVRTNTMRVYNDCLADDIARETGSDLARISTGGDADCDCAAWEGCIISISGKTKGFPSYDDARNGGCFHPNCTHTLEYIDEAADADEIALQKSVPAEADMAGDYDAQDERKYQIDQARYMRDNPGMSQEEARLAVDRDNLALSIQSGLVRDDAKEIVARMTDAQVTALCPDGNPPAFEPTKKATKADPHAADEKWNHGKYGGVVHIARNADLEKILEVCKVKDADDRISAAPAKPEPKKEEPKSKEDPEIVAARQRLAALFPESFDDTEKEIFKDIHPAVLRKYAEAVERIERTSDGSKCHDGVLVMGNTPWDKHKECYYHEAGHAVLNRYNKGVSGEAKVFDLRFPDKSKGERGRNLKFFLNGKGLELMDALKKDAEKLFDEVCGKKLRGFKRNRKTGRYEEVETNKRAWGAMTDGNIIKKLYGEEKDLYTLPLDEKRIVGAVTDTLQAITNSAFHGGIGHPESYYSDQSAGARHRVHEPFANISAMLAQSNNSELARAALDLFPTAGKMIAKDFYGIALDKPPSTGVD